MVYQDNIGSRIPNNKICDSGCGIQTPTTKDNRYLEIVWDRLNQIRYGVSEASLIIDKMNDYLVGGYPEPICEDDRCSKEPMNQTEKIDEILQDIENNLMTLHSRITKLNNSI